MNPAGISLRLDNVAQPIGFEKQDQHPARQITQTSLQGQPHCQANRTQHGNKGGSLHADHARHGHQQQNLQQHIQKAGKKLLQGIINRLVPQHPVHATDNPLDDPEPHHQRNYRQHHLGQICHAQLNRLVHIWLDLFHVHDSLPRGILLETLK